MSTVATSSNQYATSYAAGRHLWFAPDGTAIALYYDGSNWQWRTASSPYTSWSGATAVTNATREHHLSAYMDAATGNVHVAYKKASGPDVAYRLLTFSAGSWSLGSESTVYSGDGGSGTQVMDLALDSDGRIWVYGFLYTGSNTGVIYYSTNGTSWTSSVTGLPASTDLAHCQGLVRAGNYLLHIYGNGNNLSWKRVATNGSVGTWSTTQNVSTGLWSDHTWSAVADGNDRAVLVSSPAGTDYNIRTTTYSPATDTWSSTSDIGTGTSDDDPSVCRDLNGDVWCVWSEFASSTSFALVYKKWAAGTQTWGSKSTMQAAGSKRRYGGAAITADGVTLGVLDTLGTANPWTAEFLSATVGSAPAAKVPFNVDRQLVAYRWG